MANQGKRMVSEDQIKKLENLDTSKLQPKLTAGENITISEENVISAAGGGETEFYEHDITVIDDTYHATYNLQIMNSDNTPFTYTTLLNFLVNNYGISSPHSCGGSYYTTNYIVSLGQLFAWQPSAGQPYVIRGYGCLYNKSTTNFSATADTISDASSTKTFIDSVRKI